MRLPFFYGWIIIAVTFVTMAIGVNARTVVLAVLSADHRRVRMGARRHRRRLLVRLSGFRRRQPADRPHDGSLRSPHRDGARRRADGGRLVAGAADDAALASVSDHRRAGRRRQHLSRLFRSIAVSAQLVQSPARPRDGTGLRRRRHRLDHAAAVGAAHDRADRLANRLHGDGHSGSGRAGADQPVAAQAAGGHRASSRTATPRLRLIGEAGLEYRRSRLGRHRLDPEPRAAHRAVLVARDRLFRRIVHLVRGAGSPDQISARHRLQPERRGLGAGRGQPARHSRPDRCSDISPTGSGANGSGPRAASALRSALRR